MTHQDSPGAKLRRRVDSERRSRWQYTCRETGLPLAACLDFVKTIGADYSTSIRFWHAVDQLKFRLFAWVTEHEDVEGHDLGERLPRLAEKKGGR